MSDAELQRDNRLLRYQIETLELEAERLRVRLDAYEKILFPSDSRIPVAWELTVTEGRLLVALARGGIQSKDALYHFLYAHRITDAEQPDMKIVDVLIHKLRAKIKNFGFDIVTAWGRGYYIEDAVAARVRKEIRAVNESDASWSGAEAEPVAPVRAA